MTTGTSNNDKAKQEILAAAMAAPPRPPSTETTNSAATSKAAGGSPSQQQQQQWRRRGQRLRAELIEKDEAAGGQAFALSNHCPIQRYYQVADKVRLYHGARIQQC